MTDDDQPDMTDLQIMREEEWRKAQQVNPDRGTTLMKITRKSQVSGITRTLELDVTQAQLDDYASGTLVQRAFPNLTPAEREFVKSGITGEEWDELFKEEDE